MTQNPLETTFEKVYFNMCNNSHCDLFIFKKIKDYYKIPHLNKTFEKSIQKFCQKISECLKGITLILLNEYKLEKYQIHPKYPLITDKTVSIQVLNYSYNLELDNITKYALLNSSDSINLVNINVFKLFDMDDFIFVSANDTEIKKLVYHSESSNNVTFISYEISDLIDNKKYILVSLDSSIDINMDHLLKGCILYALEKSVNDIKEILYEKRCSHHWSICNKAGISIYLE